MPPPSRMARHSNRKKSLRNSKEKKILVKVHTSKESSAAQITEKTSHESSSDIKTSSQKSMKLDKNIRKRQSESIDTSNNKISVQQNLFNESSIQVTCASDDSSSGNNSPELNEETLCSTGDSTPVVEKMTVPTEIKPAEPECLNIPTDSEENKGEDENFQNIYFKVGNLMTEPNSLDRELQYILPNSSERRCLQLKENISEDQWEEEEDDEKYSLLINCHSIRIGSFKVCPSTSTLLPVYVSRNSFKFFVPVVGSELEIVNVKLKVSDIIILLAHFGRTMPLLAIYTTAGCGATICNDLRMSKSDGLYYEPGSTDETQNKIILSLRSISEEQRFYFRHTFSDSILQEINQNMANKILVQSTPSHFAKFLDASNAQLDKTSIQSTQQRFYAQTFLTAEECHDTKQSPHFIKVQPTTESKVEEETSQKNDSEVVNLIAEPDILECELQEELPNSFVCQEPQPKDIPGKGHWEDGSILIRCQSVRIGSFKVHPSPSNFLPVFINKDSFKFPVPVVDNDSEFVTLTLKVSDIVTALAHFGRAMPVLLIYTTPDCGESICRNLRMNKLDGRYYEPGSADETQNKIILSLGNISEEQQYYFKHTFSESILQEINQKIANGILIRSTSNHPATCCDFSQFLESDT